MCWDHALFQELAREGLGKSVKLENQILKHQSYTTGHPCFFVAATTFWFDLSDFVCVQIFCGILSVKAFYVNISVCKPFHDENSVVNQAVVLFENWNPLQPEDRCLSTELNIACDLKVCNRTIGVRSWSILEESEDQAWLAGQPLGWIQLHFLRGFPKLPHESCECQTSVPSWRSFAGPSNGPRRFVFWGGAGRQKEYT